MAKNGYCRVPDGSLYYEREGSGQPVVFIQGFGLNTRFWDALLPHLEDCESIRYDRRGYGLSTKPDQGRPYSDYQDLAHLLDSLHLDKVHLVAGCVGSHVALEFAVEFPQRVLSLVLSNPDAGPGVAGANEAFFKLVEDTRPFHASGDLVGALEQTLGNPIVAPSVTTEQTRFRLVRAMGGYHGWHFLHWYPRRSCSPPVSERLEQVQAPTLIISGGRDYIYFRRVAKALSAAIPGSQSHTIDDAGHYVFLEYPQLAAQLITPFIHPVA